MDFLPPAPPILPEVVLEFNLLRGYIWYISITFAFSLLLRLRFYRSIYVIAKHVSDSCPHVYDLLRQHWLLCVANGIYPRVIVYLVVMTVYMVLNEFLWPRARISMAEIASPNPTELVAMLVLIGLMITVDMLAILQVSVIDSERVVSDLNFAESWLSSPLSQFFQFFGKWNPIKRYASAKARENLTWFNEISRNNLTSLTVQVVLRIVVALGLFLNYVFDV